MDFKIGDRVVYINKLYRNEIGTIENNKPNEYDNVLVRFDNPNMDVLPILIINLRKLTKLEKALA